MSRELLTAGSISEALSLKDASSAYLAGGTEILRLGSSISTGRLIMLKKIPKLSGITKEEGNLVRIGSMTTFQEAAEDPFTPGYLKEALHFMASRTKRNMATVGGNLALLRSDSYLGAVLLAAHAKLKIVLPGGQTETVCLRKYGREKETYKDGLILAVLVRDDIRLFSRRFANTAESHSYLTVAAAMVDGKHRIGISVKNSGCFFEIELSQRLDGGKMSEAEFMDWAGSWQGLDIPDDIFGSTAYKRYLLGVTLADLLGKLDPDEAGKEGRS